MQFPWKKNISFNFCITDCLRTYYYYQFFYSLSRRLPYCSARNVSNTRDRIVKNDHAIIVGGHKNIEIQAGLFINSSPKSLSLLLMPLAGSHQLVCSVSDSISIHNMVQPVELYRTDPVQYRGFLRMYRTLYSFRHVASPSTQAK